MSNVIVNQLIILFVIINLINCNYTSIQDIIRDNKPNKIDLFNNQTTVDKRSDNVILDGIQYLPECGLICRLHRLIPPVMINFNHQYQHFIPISEPIAEPIPILNTELHHHPELLYNSDLHNHHSELHHEISHPDYNHDSELLHTNLNSDLGLHSKLFSDHHHHHHHLQSLHQIGLSNIHSIHNNQNLGLSSSNFHQLINKKPIELNHLASFSPINHQLHTSASSLHENHKLDAIQRMFAHYESKNPVTIVEENFPLPENYNSFIETHPSSLRPLFVPDKNQLKPTQAIPPYELEDSRSNFIDYQPFDHHHHLQPFHRPPHHFNNHHPIHPSPYLHGPEQIYNHQSLKKPNIEIIKLNEQDHDYPLPPPQKNHYDRLMAEVHSKIKDPTTYYQHPEPEKGSIIYADSDPEHKRPVSSKIDENSIINIGKNYGKVQHIQEQYNSMKRQYPSDEFNSGEIPINYNNKFENYNHIQHLNQPNYNNLGHHHHHHIEEHNIHFNPHIEHHENHDNHQYPHISPQPPIHYEQINNQHPPEHHLINYSRPPPPKTNGKPGMEFNGFYSNFYSNLPPASPSSYSPYKK